jgi:hypothetical protein
VSAVQKKLNRFGRKTELAFELTLKALKRSQRSTLKMSSLLATLARQSLAQFVIVYTEIYDGSAIPPEELDALMWARMCAKEANITPVGFKIPPTTSGAPR